MASTIKSAIDSPTQSCIKFSEGHRIDNCSSLREVAVGQPNGLDEPVLFSRRQQDEKTESGVRNL